MISGILAALDGSPCSVGVFAAAATMAQQFGATLYAVRVIIVPPEFPPAAAGSPKDELPDFLTREAEREMSTLVARAQSLNSSKVVTRLGSVPWRGILEVAEELEVDLIVIGSHGYRGWDRLLGTTATKVVNHSTRNVFVVHESSGSIGTRGAVPQDNGEASEERSPAYQI